MTVFALPRNEPLNDSQKVHDISTLTLVLLMLCLITTPLAALFITGPYWYTSGIRPAVNPYLNYKKPLFICDSNGYCLVTPDLNMALCPKPDVRVYVRPLRPLRPLRS